MKISVSSYSFDRLVENGSIKQVEVVARAKDMGFDNIEFSTLKLSGGETTVDCAKKLRDECERTGVNVLNYAVSADFINGSDGDWKAEAERLREELRIAAILGAPSMRHDVSRGFSPCYKGRRGFDDALPILAGGCRIVTEYAAMLGIKTMVENHGFFCQDSERLEKLTNEVDHPNFGLLVDIGNFLCADEDPEKAVGRLSPYISFAHVKDFHMKSGMLPDPGKGWFKSRGGNFLRGAIIGHGCVPVLQCLKILKEKGYDGSLSIEFEGLEEPDTGIKICFENIKRYLEMINYL